MLINKMGIHVQMDSHLEDTTHFASTPEFCSNKKIVWQYPQTNCIRCKKYQQYVMDLNLSIEKLTTIKKYNEKLLEKKQEELLQAFKILQQYERRLESYNSVIEILKSQQEQKEYKLDSIDNDLKIRQIDLLGQIQQLKQQLVVKESMFQSADGEKNKNYAKNDGDFRQYFSQAQNTDNKLIIQKNTQILDKLQLNTSSKSNQSIMNPEIIIPTKSFEKLQNKLDSLVQQQKILLLRNEVLEIKINDVKKSHQKTK